MGVAFWFACATLQSPVVEVHPSGVHLSAEGGLSSVEIYASDQSLVRSQAYPAPLNEIDFEVFWPNRVHILRLMGSIKTGQSLLRSI